MQDALVEKDIEVEKASELSSEGTTEVKKAEVAKDLKDRLCRLCFTQVKEENKNRLLLASGLGLGHIPPQAQAFTRSAAPLPDELFSYKDNLGHEFRYQF